MYVDMHSHILPGADHGSDGLETSLYQLRSALQAGVDTVLSTSHFYMHKDSVEDFSNRRQSCYETLINGMPEDIKDKLRIYLGAEVTLEVGLDKLEGLEKLCIGNTRNILIEMPSTQWTPWVYETLRKIISVRKLKPIIAHADRYMKQNSLDQLIELQIPFQINAISLEKFLLRGKIIKLFETGSALYLGSDIHMLGSGYSEYASAAKRLDYMMDEITKNSRIAIGQISDDSSPFTVKKHMI